jgi:Multicopper oxidase
MNETAPARIGRRQLFKYAGGAAALAAGAGLASRWRGPTLKPFAVERADALGPGSVIPTPPAGIDMYIGGTDGWITLPATPVIPTFHPDPFAPSPYTTYIFGFRNITDLDDRQRSLQKSHAQHNAPLFWVKEVDPAAANPRDFKVSITNLGLAQRPDLFDAHTLHWHGFRNVIPFFDGEPTGSVSVPAQSIFTYVYRPRDPGTYMYHCHVEDVEHVHMGMTGLVFVRPWQNDRWAYNDPSTAFDREYAMFLSEVWAEAHWADAHIQLPEWSDYHPDFSLLNGRVYPDTIAPNAPLPVGLDLSTWTKPYLPAAIDVDGDLVAPAGSPHLNRQPLSSLVNCNAGDKVLLRFANLGFKEAAMTMAGIKMRVVGRDATPMRGITSGGVRNASGADTSYETNTLPMGAGESYDAIFTAPAYQGPAAYDTYVLYNRNYKQVANLAPGGFGGQATEIRVYPANTLAAQVLPNQ